MYPYIDYIIVYIVVFIDGLI